MDFHKNDYLTIELVKKVYLIYLAVQTKYGVKFHQFWVLPKGKKSGNIAEIAFESGFNIPSCFAK